MSNIRRFTKLVFVNTVSFNNAHIKYPLDTSTSHDRDNNVDNDTENMATAKRFFDDFMRRIESNNKDKETSKNEDRVGEKQCVKKSY
jgi:hypothetical protein